MHETIGRSESAALYSSMAAKMTYWANLYEYVVMSANGPAGEPAGAAQEPSLRASGGRGTCRQQQIASRAARSQRLAAHIES